MSDYSCLHSRECRMGLGVVSGADAPWACNQHAQQRIRYKYFRLCRPTGNVLKPLNNHSHQRIKSQFCMLYFKKKCKTVLCAARGGLNLFTASWPRRWEKGCERFRRLNSGRKKAESLSKIWGLNVHGTKQHKEWVGVERGWGGVRLTARSENYYRADRSAVCAEAVLMRMLRGI